MPLKGTETDLAEKIAKAVASDLKNIPYAKVEWEKIVKVIIEHFISNTQVKYKVDGVEVNDGKIQ